MDSAAVWRRSNRAVAPVAAASRPNQARNRLPHRGNGSDLPGHGYLLLDVLDHPPAEAFLGSVIVTAIAGAIPVRFYRRLAGEKQ
jgi:hypothetical protein